MNKTAWSKLRRARNFEMAGSEKMGRLPIKKQPDQNWDVLVGLNRLKWDDFLQIILPRIKLRYKSGLQLAVRSRGTKNGKTSNEKTGWSKLGRISGPQSPEMG